MPWAVFNRFEVDMPEDAVRDLSASGPVDDAAEHWAPLIPRPDRATPEALALELREYGAWDTDELADDSANWRRILWIGAGNINDGSN